LLVTGVVFTGTGASVTSFRDDAKQRMLKALPHESKNVRILTIDIESKPLTVYTWSLWDQHVGIDQIVDHGGMMCFAAKWAGDKEVLFFSEFHHGYEAMLQAAWDLLSEADVVVTYNGDRYDIKKLNQAFMLAGMRPPKPFKSIDLIKTNKSRFDLPSRKLDYLVRQSGVGAKVKHQGFDLWIDCMAGDAKAWDVMEKYNRGDVVVTEKAYLRLLPWLTNSPHLAMFTREGRSCPYCGGKKLNQDGYTHTNVQSYRLYECLRCGGWARGTVTLQDATRTRATR
jgi:DNA-directed RNA polymerase subunit RPC12/RpoP